MKTRKITDSELRDRVREDSHIWEAVTDLIAAIQSYGRHRVSGDTLFDAIEISLARHQCEEIEMEGLDHLAPLDEFECGAV